MKRLLSSLLLAFTLVRPLPAQDLRARLAVAVEAVTPRVVEWRRDLHRHPELSNREERTAGVVAGALRRMGLEVETGVAHTGVVARLRGGRPGPVVALRADMDALPVTEQTGLPFASTVRTTFNGQEVGVMHACGHDAHTAMLLGAAEALASLRADLPGTVLFIFQPAEEGTPPGEEGGARLMLKEGLFDGADRPAAVFGLHVWPMPPGTLLARSEGTLAAADRFEIVVQGQQTHGSSPWRGVDPVTVAAQIVTALQTIPSRQLDVTRAPAVVSVGSLHGGIRFNIIPDTVSLVGTIRTFDEAMQQDLHDRLRRTAEKIAESAGATARVTIERMYPVTYNDPALTRWAAPTLAWAAGADRVQESPRVMAAEDFSFYQREVPGFFFFLGVNADGVSPEDAAPNHSPRFFVNEAALPTGVRALAGLAVDYLLAQ